jgi:hypothetical protein
MESQNGKSNVNYVTRDGCITKSLRSAQNVWKKRPLSFLVNLEIFENKYEHKKFVNTKGKIY